MSAADPATARGLTVFLGWLGAEDLTASLAPPRAIPAWDGPQVLLPQEPLAWAAAAHVAAHRRYSRHRFPAHALTPITRALIGLLEDARVEWRAQHDPEGLPGLRRLWAPEWQTLPRTGTSCEALFGRLARVLADPTVDDDHPWVQKGRGLFFADAAATTLRVLEGEPEGLRYLAGRLGHDLGQARLPFNDRTYRVQPAYRDDHRWLWEATAAPRAADAPPPPTPAEGAPAAPPEGIDAEVVRRYPEWDHLIGRLRPRWCMVRCRRAPARASPDLDAGLVRALAQRWRTDAATRRRSPLTAHGEDLDLPAVVEARVEHHRGGPVEDRVYRRRETLPERSRLIVVVDGSASTAATGGRLLAAGRLAAAAWRHHGGQAEFLLFRSWGREAVELWEDPEPSALTAAGSTRLGAVLREVRWRLGTAPGRVLLLTDGQPHDIDQHDPRYLVEDARRAVQDLRREGQVVGAIITGTVLEDPRERQRLDHWLGRHAWHPLPRDLRGLRLPG